MAASPSIGRPNATVPCKCPSPIPAGFCPRPKLYPLWADEIQLHFTRDLNGEWEQARALLEGCVNSDPGDRPPAVLLEYMEERDFVAPPTWSGHRELTSK